MSSLIFLVKAFFYLDPRYAGLSPWWDHVKQSNHLSNDTSTAYGSAPCSDCLDFVGGDPDFIPIKASVFRSGAAALHGEFGHFSNSPY
jgi:hypothetical protein